MKLLPKMLKLKRLEKINIEYTLVLLATLMLYKKSFNDINILEFENIEIIKND